MLHPNMTDLMYLLYKAWRSALTALGIQRIKILDFFSMNKTYLNCKIAGHFVCPIYFFVCGHLDTST